MAALFRAADVMVVTPLRDGMNLVAKEYVACRYDDDGALVLSEFAGAADELKQAYLVNPYDINGLKDAMLAAMNAEPKDRADGCARCASRCPSTLIAGERDPKTLAQFARGRMREAHRSRRRSPAASATTTPSYSPRCSPVSTRSAPTWPTSTKGSTPRSPLRPSGRTPR